MTRKSALPINRRYMADGIKMIKMYLQDLRIKLLMRTTTMNFIVMTTPKTNLLLFDDN